MSSDDKPQHMPVGERNVLRSNDSLSLWNCTLSPGWTQKEVDILRLALMKFGIGNWSKIIQSQCLLGKTVAQLNLQTQKLLGQQSTAEFANLHVDPLEINKRNAKKFGPEIKRKNGFIVNTGAKLSKEEKLRRLTENKKNFGLSKEEINAIVLPSPKEETNVLEELKLELKSLKKELSSIQEEIQLLKKPKKIKLVSDNKNENTPTLKIRLKLGTLKLKDNKIKEKSEEVVDVDIFEEETIDRKRKIQCNYNVTDSSLTDFSSDFSSDF
ncbi:hypothetical protein K502DRAFT_347116 [Neoconidiobolus thromboides FSU 785]|nr:hypothetical protein K502DRAFT_347116 [Neoconidiobolus thromboides FSU 785]